MYVKQARDHQRRDEEDRARKRENDERPGLTRVRLLSPARRGMDASPAPAKRTESPPGETGRAPSDY